MAAQTYLPANGGGLVNIRASIVLQSSAILGSNAMLPYAEWSDGIAYRRRL